MDYRIENINDNVKVSLIDEENVLSEAICYFKNTPKVNGNNIGCIGDFVSKNKDAGKKVLEKCEEILKNENVKLIVGPMNGNTWRKYRTLKWSRGDKAFLLENVNPIEDNDVFIERGFKEMYTYTSTKGLVSDCYSSKALEISAEKLKENNITIRSFNKENAIEDLEKIYNVSKISFTRNPFYTPIDKDSFIKQYEKYLDMIKEDFILLAEQDGKEIGFIFCIPNYNELQEGKKVETLIVKTVAVLPEYENFVIGNILLNKIGVKALEQGFKDWIFAFMYRDNTSQKMAQRNKTELIREYSIYGKEI